MSLQAVILAGGKGTRLRERLHGRPKPLVDVDGIPLLERQLRLLAQNGFSEALILVISLRIASAAVSTVSSVNVTRFIGLVDDHLGRAHNIYCSLLNRGLLL